MYINQLPFVHVGEKDLRAYQSAVVPILTDIHEAAEKAGTHYHLEAGSLLGAIRHNGFIPWDNDADVLMLFDELEKFFVAFAERGLFEKCSIWYHGPPVGWLRFEDFIPRILEDPSQYCSRSLNKRLAIVETRVPNCRKGRPGNRVKILKNRRLGTGRPIRPFSQY